MRIDLPKLAEFVVGDRCFDNASNVELESACRLRFLFLLIAEFGVFVVLEWVSAL